MALNEKQQRFVEEYIVDLNGASAARRAGYSEDTARQIASELLTKPDIQEAIEQAKQERSERVKITADMVIQQWWDIATADPNDLIQYQRICCRYCYGKDHQYQWTESEFALALQSYEQQLARYDENDDKQKKPEPPTCEGGFGFSPKVDPLADCPKCFGEGHGQVHVNDTRKLSGGARLLYAGLKQTKDGIEIKMHDQEKARDNLAKHVGLYQDKLQITGSINEPVQITVVRPNDSRSNPASA